MFFTTHDCFSNALRFCHCFLERGWGLNMGIEEREEEGERERAAGEEGGASQRRASGAGGGPPTGINVFGLFLAVFL